MSEPTKEEKVLPLADIALEMVRLADEGAEERLTIHPKGPDVIKAGVRALLLSGVTNDQKIQALRKVVVLCVVLDERERCPTAAATLFEALTSDPEVASMLRRRDGRQATKRYRQFLDDRDVERAPKIDAAAPDGSLKLHSMINPGQERAARPAGPAGERRRGEATSKEGAGGRQPPKRRGGFDT